MKQSKLLIKDTGSLVLQGMSLATDTAFYWYNRVRNTARGLVFDAFSLNVAGAVADFHWEEWEQESNVVEVQPAGYQSRKNRNYMAGGERSEKKTPFVKVNAKRFFLKRTKAILRFIILDIPDSLRKKSNFKEEVDPYANRFRT